MLYSDLTGGAFLQEGCPQISKASNIRARCSAFVGICMNVSTMYFGASLEYQGRQSDLMIN